MTPVEAALRSWQLAPVVACGLLATALVYRRGWRALHEQMPERFPGWRLSTFALGLGAVLIAIASPLDAFAAFSLQVHMVQHLLLMMVAPPLIWLGAPAMPLLRGLPVAVAKRGLGPFLAWPALQRLARALVHPLIAWPVFAAALVLWHLPAAYQLALRVPIWHQLEHLCFLLTALLFWFPVVQPWPSLPAWPRWAMVPYLLLADVVNTILSAVLTFSDRVLYPAYADAPRLWGGSALSDQATAGALMWVPGSIAYLAAVVLIVRELLEPTPYPDGAPRSGAPRRRRSGALREASWTPGTPARRFDLLAVPGIGTFLRWRLARRTLQAVVLVLAVAVIADGLLGPRMSPMNLAGVLPWTHWRGLSIVALLVAGNVFCMACPFMLPREAAKRWFAPTRAWPRWLRGKWLAAALLLLYLWSYEAFAPWDSPRATAVIALAYFTVAFAVDALFRGAGFCRYVCPIGQFHFVQSLASPLEVGVRDARRCAACTTHDCLRGNATQRGCELELFQPEKRGNFDCTFCLDCVHACPHDNVGLLVAGERSRLPAALRRLAERPGVAALVLVSVFGAFANAAAMVEPVLAAERQLAERLGWSSTLAIATAGLVLALLVAPALTVGGAAWLSARLAHPRLSMRVLAAQFALALVPLGTAMWAAHFLFHFFSGATALWPVAQRVALDLGDAVLGTPAWAASAPLLAAERVTALELLLLDGGLLLSLHTGWRVAARQCGRGRRALLLLAPWALLMLALWAAGAWVTFQPMAMRGMVH